MPGFHFLNVKRTIPLWLRLALDIFDVLEPQYAWLDAAVVSAYEVFEQLPWFHRVGALKELRLAVMKSKIAKRTGAEHPCCHIDNWSILWRNHSK